MVGTTHEPFASLTDPDGPVTAKPLQFVLVTLSLWILGALISEGVGSAAANPSIDITKMVVVARVDLTRNFVANFLAVARENKRDKICGLVL